MKLEKKIYDELALRPKQNQTSCDQEFKTPIVKKALSKKISNPIQYINR